MVNILHRNPGTVTGLDLGYRTIDQLDKAKKSIKCLYLLAADEVKINRADFGENLFIIYQGRPG